jgi:hypothetical protein
VQEVVVQSLPFDSPKEVGRAIADLKKVGENLDRLISDIELSGEVLANLRIYPNTPVVIITAESTRKPVAFIPEGVVIERVESVLASISSKEDSP